MDRKHQLFTTQVAVPTHLTDRICAKIIRIERRLATIRAGITGSVTVLSIISIFPISSLVYSRIIEGGFADYLQLLVSDWDVLISNWGTFSLSLAESIPLTGLIALIGVAFIFFWSLRYAVRNTRIALTAHHFA